MCAVFLCAIGRWISLEECNMSNEESHFDVALIIAGDDKCGNSAKFGELLCLVLPKVLRNMRFMDDTLGRESRKQIPSYSNFSRISHANSDEFCSLYCLILLITNGVETRGLLPPYRTFSLSKCEKFKYSVKWNK